MSTLTVAPASGSITTLAYVVGQTSGTTISVTPTVTPPITTPVPTYQWSSGPTISSATPISGATSASYTVPTTAAATTAVYFCVVSQTGATNSPVTSGTFSVTVNKALTITTQPTAVSAKKGASAAFTVVASGGTGNYTYAWMLGGNAIGTSSGTLTISAVTTAQNNLPVVVTITDTSNPPQTIQSTSVLLTVTSGLAWWVYVIIAVVVILVIVAIIIIIVLVIRSNHKKAAAAAAAAAIAAQPVAATTTTPAPVVQQSVYPLQSSPGPMYPGPIQPFRQSGVYPY